MNQNPIAQWFENGKDYYSGVMLLRQYGINTAYFDRYLTANVPPQYQALRLADELNACFDLKIVTTQHPTSINQTYKVASIIPERDAEPFPIILLREEAKPWHKLEADNHARLHLAGSQDERREIAQERMTVIAPALDGIYHQIRVWKETGELPSSKIEALQSDKARLNDLWREKLSIEPRLSKIKKQEKFKTEILEKFERLKAVHVELDLPFEKNINDYL